VDEHRQPNNLEPFDDGANGGYDSNVVVVLARYQEKKIGRGKKIRER
jgi:hypothetical protein